MENYLIEFRFSGYAKRYLKKTIYEVGRKFRVSGVTQKHVVPHITMFGPFTTSNESKMVSKFVSVSKKYSLIPFKLKGFGNFDNRVIFVEVIPSEKLKEYRRELAKGLTGLRNFFIFKTIKTKGITDYKDYHAFHATIAFKDIGKKFNQILSYLKNRHSPHIEQKLLRMTLLKNGKIFYEYDFLQRRLLNRGEALSKGVWSRTINLLKNGNR